MLYIFDYPWHHDFFHDHPWHHGFSFMIFHAMLESFTIFHVFIYNDIAEGALLYVLWHELAFYGGVLHDTRDVFSLCVLARLLD